MGKAFNLLSKYFFVFISISFLIAVYVHELIAFLAFAIVLILIKPFERRFREFKQVIILLDEEGITLVERNETVKWKDIESY